MTSINQFSPAYTGLLNSPVDDAFCNNIAKRAAFARNSNDTGDKFESSKPKKLHPIKALLSYALPGTGELLNGDAKGFYRLGAQGLLLASAVGLYKIKALKTGIGKIAAVAGYATIGLLAMANSFTSSIIAAKGKQSNSEKQNHH